MVASCVEAYRKERCLPTRLSSLLDSNPTTICATLRGTKMLKSLMWFVNAVLYKDLFNQRIGGCNSVILGTRTQTKSRTTRNFEFADNAAH